MRREDFNGDGTSTGVPTDASYDARSWEPRATWTAQGLGENAQGLGAGDDFADDGTTAGVPTDATGTTQGLGALDPLRSSCSSSGSGSSRTSSQLGSGDDNWSRNSLHAYARFRTAASESGRSEGRGETPERKPRRRAAAHGGRPEECEEIESDDDVDHDAADEEDKAAEVNGVTAADEGIHDDTFSLKEENGMGFWLVLE